MTKNVKAVKMEGTKFQVVTPHRIYYFKGLTKESAEEWVQAINDAIKNYCVDS